MIQHTAPISGIAAYQDRYVATAGYDNRVIAWDAKSKMALACGFHDHLANQCQFSQDGRYLASSGSDHTVRLWSLPTMKLIAVMSTHEDDVEGIAFHPHEDKLATVSRDNKVRIFNFHGQLLQTLTGHRQDVLSVVWVNDHQLITSSDDGTVKVWDTETAQVLEDIDLGGVETDTIAITTEGLIFAGNDLGEIYLIQNGEQQKVKAHQAGIKRLCYQPEQKLLVSLSYDRSASLWQFTDNTLKLVKTTHLPNVVWARSVDFLADGQLVFATFGSHYALYDYVKDLWFIDHIAHTFGKNAVLVDGEDVYTIGDAGILHKNDAPIKALPSLCNFLIKAGKDILTGGQTGEIFIGQTGEVIYQHRSPINCAAIFNKENEMHVIFGTYTGEGLVFKKQDQRYQLIKTIALHSNAIKGIAASKDFIYSVCATSAAAFHRISDFEQQYYLLYAHDKIANGCVYIEDDLFASISRDLTLRLTTPNKKIVIATPHTHSIKCIAVSNDKRFIATGGYHGMVAIYDRHTQNWQVSRPTISGISCITFDSKIPAFQASSYDGKVYRIALKDNGRV